MGMMDGSEEYVHLGKVILQDKDGGKDGRERSRSRGRRTSAEDWSRMKGRTDKELLDDMRSRERDRAVCSSGKDYARKPIGYKAACALAREQGKASYRLMEDETFVPTQRPGRTRTPSPQREGAFGKRQDSEHQARMQQIYEKYGSTKTAEAGGSVRSDEVDRAERMRL